MHLVYTQVCNHMLTTTTPISISVQLPCPDILCPLQITPTRVYDQLPCGIYGHKGSDETFLLQILVPDPRFLYGHNYVLLQPTSWKHNRLVSPFRLAFDDLKWLPLHMVRHQHELMGKDGSKCTNRGASVNNFFVSVNDLAWSLPHFHSLPFLSNVCKGSDTVDRAGK